MSRIRITSSPGQALVTGFVATVAALGLVSFKQAQVPFTLEIGPHAAPFAAGEQGDVTVHGEPGLFVLFMVDTDSRNSVLPLRGGISINLGQSSDFTSLFGRLVDDSLTVSCSVDCATAGLFGMSFYAQALSFDPVTKQIEVSNREELSWEDLNNDCCDTCDGEVTDVSLQYNGSSAVQVHVQTASGSLTLFDAVVQPDEVFTFFGLGQGGTMGAGIKLSVDCGPWISLDTSCDKPIGPGLVVGEFEVVAGASLNGGPLCDVVNVPSTNVCEDGRPAVLTVSYTGDGCEASNHSQSSKKASCWGDPEDEAQVHVLVKDKYGSVYFQGDVAVGASFDIDAAVIGREHLKSKTEIYIWNLDCSELLQVIKFRTSCSEPLLVGNQFGSIRIDGFVLE